MTDYKPKLIEVALPLAAINKAAAKEKSIRHGHPSMLHLWWARRPLAAARAVIWASLVDDPSGDDSLSEREQDEERQRLFGILERLVQWENSNDPAVLADAKAEIDRCFPDGPPPILDPFAGGGAIPLEAQRLGLTALAGDLNPVAVLIQKAMLEVAPRFTAKPAVHPDLHDTRTSWGRAQGLAADVEAYGRWMRIEAAKRIGHLYPTIEGRDGKPLTPIAWIWARTVPSPNPSWQGEVPLVPSWALAKRPKAPLVWVEPTIDRASETISYVVRTDGEPTAPATMHRGTGTCLATGSAILGDYIRKCGHEKKLGAQLIAIVADGDRTRTYLSGVESHALIAKSCLPPDDVPRERISSHPRDMRIPNYGVEKWSEIYTPRQLIALSTFSELLSELWERVRRDAGQSYIANELRLRDGGTGNVAYADAVVTWMAFVLDRCADYWSMISSWHAPKETIRNTFARQAIAMTWTFAETNPFSGATGSFDSLLQGTAKAISALPASGVSEILQRDARDRLRGASPSVVSTDPPYYDNVSYAILSDFFFTWLRRHLTTVWPDECATLQTPKADELVADRHRHGSLIAADGHFERGMREFMAELRKVQVSGIPASIYYAYRATESEGATGWSTFLQAVLDAGLQVTATWPLRTELQNRMNAHGTNALASSVVLMVRPRGSGATMASRAEFVSALKKELADAVHVLQSGNIAPVDLAQSAIGPGMKVFSRYAKVVEAGGSSMSVSSALSVINDALGEILDGEEAQLDRDTRFALAWYAQYGYEAKTAGVADTLAKAKDTSLEGLVSAGIGKTLRGNFRLLARHELLEDWDPAKDERLTVWEATQHLILALAKSESAAATLLHRMGSYGDSVRQLAYLLFQKSSDNSWSDEATAYNGLITAWPSLLTMDPGDDGQGSLLVNDELRE